MILGDLTLTDLSIYRVKLRLKTWSKSRKQVEQTKFFLFEDYILSLVESKNQVEDK